MDIFSHGLWGALLAKSANKKLQTSGKRDRRRWDPLLAAFWGVFPDLVAFMPIFLLFGEGILSGHVELHNLPRPHQADLGTNNSVTNIFGLTALMYSVTHSAITFAVVFFGVWVFRKVILRRRRAPIWEMSAWFLHVVMDLPTHSYKFYPTPILWPFSAWRFDGVPWSTPWVFALNCSLLLAGYIIVNRKKDEPEISEPALVLASKSRGKRWFSGER